MSPTTSHVYIPSDRAGIQLVTKRPQHCSSFICTCCSLLVSTRSVPAPAKDTFRLVYRWKWQRGWGNDAISIKLKNYYYPSNNNNFHRSRCFILKEMWVGWVSLLRSKFIPRYGGELQLFDSFTNSWTEWSPPNVLNECILLAAKASKGLSGRIVEIPIHGRILKPHFNAIALGHGLPAQLIFARVVDEYLELLYKRW